MTSILLYHRIAQISDQHDPKGLTVSPQRFERQMASLHHAGYRCISLVDAVNSIREGLRLPRKSFVLTFDDGYQDLYDNVWPILDRYGFTATIFLVAGSIGRLSNWGGQTGPSAAPLMSWAEVQELARRGLSFGSHTLTHRRLTLLDDKQAIREIQQSKEVIEGHLRTKVNLFAYPYGDSDPRIQRMVAESGYIAACGVDRGPWGFFNLWRAECFSKESSRSFSRKASGWYYKFIWLREQSFLGRLLRQIMGLLKNRSRGIAMHN